MATQHIFVVVHKNKKGPDAVASVHTSKDEAEASATEIGDVAVVKHMSIGGKSAGKANTSKARARKAKDAVDEDEDEEMADGDEEGEEGEEEEKAAAKPAKKAKAAAPKKNDKKEVPDGKLNALKGLRLLFTGTFDTMDRSTCEATAEHYGASITKKLVDTDYIVLGVRAGQKKLDEIEEKGLDTITEPEFFQLLKTGVSDEKRRQMSERAANEEPAKKKARK